jgi:hypothetical protein
MAKNGHSGFTGHERATTIQHTAPGCGIVTYHGTDVCTVAEHKGEFTCTIRTNGYHTATTTRRLNQAFSLFNVPAHAYRKDYALYVDIDDPDYSYTITVSSYGSDCFVFVPTT